MLKKRNNKILIAVIIFILFYSCNASIDEDKINDRIDTLIGDWGNIDAFSSKFDFIEKNYGENIFTNDAELHEQLGYAYNMVATKETAIKIAEAVYMENIGDKINYYKPFYAVLYKNIWVVYGCYDIKNAAVIVISKHTGEIWGKTTVFRR